MEEIAVEPKASTISAFKKVPVGTDIRSHTRTVGHAHSHSHAKSEGWDKFGIFLSTVCAIHCLITPILVISLPLLAEKFENPMVHILLALLVVPVGTYAFLSGYLNHRRKNILALGLAGVFIVGGASLAPLFVEHFDAEAPVTIFGSLLLLTAHIWNRRSCRCHQIH